jgi:ATP-dependent DNA helicase RecG
MDLNTLIAECTAYDYKGALEESRPKSWLKSVSAFANTLGGSLFFGIDNDGNVKGLDDISSLRRNPVLADVMAQLDYWRSVAAA